MVDLLEMQSELAKKYAQTIDHAAYKYIDNTIGWLKEQGKNPEDYELAMVSKNHVDDPLRTEWTLSIRKKGAVGIVD